MSNGYYVVVICHTKCLKDSTGVGVIFLLFLYTGHE